MTLYRVIGRPVAFGPGQMLLLASEQIAPRARNLEVVEPGKERSRVRTRAAVEFKAGEIIGLAEMPKGLADRLVPVNAPAPAELPLEARRERARA